MQQLGPQERPLDPQILSGVHQPVFYKSQTKELDIRSRDGAEAVDEIGGVGGDGSNDDTTR